MPEIRFQIQWPDGSQELCYSPSLVVKQYFSPDSEYKLEEFMEKARTSLQIASDRVLAKYGMPCSLALNQIKHLETKSAAYEDFSEAKVKFIQFLE